MALNTWAPCKVHREKRFLRERATMEPSYKISHVTISLEKFAHNAIRLKSLRSCCRPESTLTHTQSVGRARLPLSLNQPLSEQASTGNDLMRLRIVGYYNYIWWPPCTKVHLHNFVGAATSACRLAHLTKDIAPSGQ